MNGTTVLGPKCNFNQNNLIHFKYMVRQCLSLKVILIKTILYNLMNEMTVPEHKGNSNQDNFT